MAKKSAVRITPSTGNVFRDLGFSKEESEHLLVRADLLIQLQKAIAARGLKQAEAAKVLRVTGPGHYEWQTHLDSASGRRILMEERQRCAGDGIRRRTT